MKGDDWKLQDWNTEICNTGSYNLRTLNIS